jgi:protein SCO1/2
MRGLGAVIAVLLTGSAVLWQATDGLQALTTESARRLAVERAPRTLHDPLLQDQFGRGFRLSDYRGRRLLVQFIFTRCATLCLALGDDFAALLSISFDPAYDGIEELAGYADRFGADGEGWRIARLVDAAELPQLLDDFGVVVIPDPDFGFQHNAAQHLVDPAGRLARIFDYSDPQASLRALEP